MTAIQTAERAATRLWKAAGAKLGLTPNELSVLKVLRQARDSYLDFCYMDFRAICRRTKLNRATVRRACRSLARKGYAQYGKGLWNDQGTPAGSGYAATSALDA